MLKEAMVGGIENGKVFILQNGIFLVLTLLVAIGLKYHYSKAGSEDLLWILRPTAKLVEQISGIRFEEEANTGFISRTHRIIIAPACAGVNFLIIAFCMAAFSGFHQIEYQRSKCLWLIASISSAYLLTIFVNALRIILSIHFYGADLYFGWITPQRVHRLEGVIIYFFFLCLFYRIIKNSIYHFTQEAAGRQKGNIGGKRAHPNYLRWALAGLVPLFWYGLITLVIPLINGAIGKNGVRFAEHSGMIFSGCLIVLVAVFLLQLGWEQIRRLKNKWV